MGIDPPPRSPERINILPDISARYEEGRGTLVTFTVRYEEWCCAESHELVDAIAAVVETLESASEDARRDRRNKANEEVIQLLNENTTRRSDEQLELF